MKILFIQNTCTISEGVSGGEWRLYHVFQSLRKKFECAFTAFFCLRWMNEEFGIEEGIIRRYSRYDRCSIYVAHLLKCMDLLVRLTRPKEHYDVVYAASDFFPDVIPACFYRLTRRQSKWMQCIFHIYPNWRTRPGNKLVNFLAQKMQRVSFFLIRRRADLVIVINHGVRRDLIALGFSEQKVQFSPCGADIEFLQKMKPSSTSYDGIFLSRLSPSKGIFDLIDVWRLVCRQLPAAKLAIMGPAGEDETAKVRHKISELGLSANIDVLGYVEKNTAFGLLKAGKVFLFPSHEEGWGMVITESMACGVPVVAWNLPVFDELYENHIFKIPENDINAFAAKVIELLSNKDLRASTVEKAERFVVKYSWPHMEQREEDLLLSIIRN